MRMVDSAPSADEARTAEPARPELVTAVVPAYNASMTIAETLASIRAQTHQELEVLVIDDGSIDDTADIVVGLAAIDPRIRLIRQANGGVAAARNRGIAEARGDYIAPIDADDLWRPDKIARQLQAFRSGGQRVGLVYCWFALIDEKSRIINLRHRPRDEGDVLARMCLGNLIGNGSSALMRKSAVIEAGGYDPTLRARSAEGCEDLKLQFQIAERYHFAVVPDHLTGYRRTAMNMSNDVTQMIRSYDLVVSEVIGRYPQYAREFHKGRNYVFGWLLPRAIRFRRFHDAAHLIRMMLAHDGAYCSYILAVAPLILARNVIWRPTSRLVRVATRPHRRVSSSHFLAATSSRPDPPTDAGAVATL